MRIFIIMILFIFNLSANWETKIKLSHDEMSQAYVVALEANKRADMMCRGQIAMAQHFKDEMSDSDKDKAKLEHYIKMVKYYCSKVAGCQCKRG